MIHNTNSKSLLEYFKEIEDPRIERHKLYELEEILLLTTLATICGAEGFSEIEEFGKSKIDFLQKFLPFLNGIPSHDTIGRVLSLIDINKFEKFFVDWIKSLSKQIQEVISIDGKSLRRACNRGDEKNKKMIQMVSAWGSESDMVLGSVKVNDKSNEIKAIPKLLELLDINNCIITIDAIGTQKEVVKDVINKGADYILPVKDNQKSLHEDVKLFLDEELKDDNLDSNPNYKEIIDADHGRVETRRYYVTDDVDWLRKRHTDWWELNLIGVVESIRFDKQTKKQSKERRYYISSLKPNVTLFANSVRKHWNIENKLHWRLDVIFKDDDNRTRNQSSATNLSIIKRIVLNVMQKYKKTKKISMKSLVKKAGWHEETLRGICQVEF